MPEATIERRLAAILAADVVGYSRLIRADEGGTLDRFKALRAELIDPAIAAHRGRTVKLMGDGLLAEFGSVVDAVRTALAIQQAMAERNAALPEAHRIVLRVGINLGDVVIDGDDIHGDGVNVAARLEGLAEPGGICVSGGVYEQIRDRIEAPFEDLGERIVKNIDRPVRVWQWRAEASSGVGAIAGSVHPLPPQDRPSIAVLPFDNMSGDAEQDYFADGIAEDIITDLSKIAGLFVIARNSSFAYKGKSTDVRRVCRELGVRHVLEGSVRKAGNRVRISAQLIDGTSGGHLWADRFDRSLDDIFAVQDEVTSAIVQALELTLSAGERQRVAQREPVNLDAYDLYLKARGLFFRFTKETNAEALRLYEQAYALDSSFGQALVGAASCHLRIMTQVWSERPEDSLQTARDLAEQAIALDPMLGEAHAIRGFVLLWQKAHDAALESLERGISLDPNNSLAHAFYAMTLNYAGRPREGIREAQIALRLDPQHSPAHAMCYFFLGFGFLLDGRPEEALGPLEQSSTLIPDFLPPHLIRAVVCAKLGRLEDARAEVAKVRALSPIATLSWLRTRVPFKHAKDMDMVLQAARAAGLPE